MWLFLGWILLELVLLVVYHSRGKVVPILRLVIAQAAGDVPSEDDFLLPRVIWVFITAFVAINVFAVFLYVQAMGGSRLALAGFALVAAWSFYDAIAKPLAFHRLHPGHLDRSDWAFVALDAFMWPLLSVSLAVHLLNQTAPVA